MTEEKQYFWKDAEGKFINMSIMNPEHLQRAHTHACVQEFKYHQLSGFFSDKRDELEEVAEQRGIKLAYPDEKHPSPKWRNYFANILKTKKVKSVKTSPLISSYKGLEQINVLD